MFAPLKWIVATGLVVASISECQAAIGSFTLGDLHDDGELVGTVNDPNNDTEELANELIGEYNDNSALWSNAPGPALSAIIDQLGKIEIQEAGGGAFDSGAALSLSDFTFYTWDGSNFVSTSDFSQPILGFEYGGTEEIGYYAAKADGDQGGWSLWSYQTDAINKVYVDIDGDLDTLYDAALNKNGNASFDLSHITFYAAEERDDSDLPGLPEPTSIAAWLIGAGAFSLILRRRVKKDAA